MKARGSILGLSLQSLWFVHDHTLLAASAILHRGRLESQVEVGSGGYMELPSLSEEDPGPSPGAWSPIPLLRSGLATASAQAPLQGQLEELQRP